MKTWNGAGIVRVHTRDVYTSDFGHMNQETHCHIIIIIIIIISHWPKTEHGSTTNLIKSAELTRDPTWNSFGWNAVPPIQFLWPSRTNQIDYQIKHGQNRYVAMRLTIFSNTWHSLKITDSRGVGMHLFLSILFYPYRFWGLNKFESQMLFASLLRPRHDI